VITAGGLSTHGADEITSSATAERAGAGLPALSTNSAVAQAGPAEPRKKAAGLTESLIDPPVLPTPVVVVVRVTAEEARRCTLAAIVADPGVRLVVTGTGIVEVPAGMVTLGGTVTTDGSLDTNVTGVGAPRVTALPPAPSNSR
jgi:hypothetical protein